MIRTFHHSDHPAERLSVERAATVSVVVPTRECAATIGPIAETLSALRERGVIDQVLVVDAGRPSSFSVSLALSPGSDQRDPGAR